MHSIPSSVLNALSNAKTNYIFSNADNGKNILLSASAGMAVVSPNWTCNVKNTANVRVSITPSVGLIDGKKSINLYPNESCTITSDGTNFYIFGRSKIVVMQTTNISSGIATQDILGLKDAEMALVQIDFYMRFSTNDYPGMQFAFDGLVSNSSFYTTSIVNIYPGNYPYGPSVGNTYIPINSYSSSNSFQGNLKIMGFQTSNLNYTGYSGTSVNAANVLLNGTYSNGLTINNFDGIRLFNTNNSNSGAVITALNSIITGYRS